MKRIYWQLKIFDGDGPPVYRSMEGDLEGAGAMAQSYSEGYDNQPEGLMGLRFEIVPAEMTEEEFEALPEFEGF